MDDVTIFSVRLDPVTRRELKRIAASMERKPGDAVRVLIRKEAKRLNRTASTSSTLAGGEVDAAHGSDLAA
jgi:hypothetical protein